ncbi:MAG TPA: DUF3047 domain-containing protein [Syntrophales bacterium]|nr:DUF3047 domain-containing protein [Syntrophales bacterium]
MRGIIDCLNAGKPGKTAMRFWISALILIITLSSIPVLAENKQILFHEAFNSLSNWEPLTFPKIKKHSTYTIVTEGGHSFLKAESHASASAIVYQKTFNVYEYSRMRWQWKVDNVYKKGDPHEKSGDDYPIRIYVMFQYDLNHADFTQRLQYGIAKTLYGKYPPDSTLNYVWTGFQTKERIITSPYTDRAKIIILENDRSKVGTWVEETVNILEDYRVAFGKEPPATAGIAIMNDSDDTGEMAVSYVNYIEVFK